MVRNVEERIGTEKVGHTSLNDDDDCHSKIRIRINGFIAIWGILYVQGGQRRSSYARDAQDRRVAFWNMQEGVCTAAT